MMIARAMPVRGKRHWRVTGVLGLLLVGGLLLVTGEARSATVLEGSSSRSVVAVPAPADGLTEMPSKLMDGLLRLVVPPGAAADQHAGGRGYAMPSVISLAIGDTIVIRNEDDTPHMILYAFLMPGETHERTFTAAGSEVYSSGCGLHAAAILNFTTIFVSESGPDTPTV